MMAISSKYVAATFPLLAAIFYFLQHFYLRTSRRLRLLEIERKAPLYTQITETLEGLPTIRAFGRERRAEEKMWRILDDSQRPLYLLYCLQRWLIFCIDMIITLLALVLVALVTTLRGEVGPGYMGIALTNIMSFSVTMKGLMLTWTMLEVSIGAIARVKRFVGDVKSEGDSELSVRPRESWPDRGAVVFRNVSASYA